jgi:hypothetical protein
MQYNQPADQPSNPNAPYVDGNPAAGIQGSIVPAHSIEYDQREIVEVIVKAYQRGYRDFTGTLCAAPTNADLEQLRKALEGFIDSAISFPSWYIDTPTTFTVHGSGADFTDLMAAFEYLSKYIITHNGSVTLRIAAGAWNYGTTNITLDHPNADRITVTGATMLSTPVAADFTVTGFSTAQRATDRANTLTALRTRYATELDFSAGGGIFSTGLGMTLQNLLIVGDRTPGGTLYGMVQVNAGLLFVNMVATCNSGTRGFSCNGGTLKMINGVISCSGAVGNGFGIADSGNIFHLQQCSLWSTSNDGSGFAAAYNGGITGFASAIAKGNGGSGAAATFGQLEFAGNGGGFNLNAGSGVFVDQGQFQLWDNGTGGTACPFNNNGAYGVQATVASTVQLSFPGTFSGNGAAVSIWCGYGSFTYAVGSTLGATLPPVNTVSGSQGYISA